MEESRVNQRLRGQRFCPMDDELVLFYLKPMLSGMNVPARNRVVFDCDLYGQKEPWEIWEEYRTRRPHDLRLNKDIYFFTQHKKMSATDKRIRRNVGSGTWHGDDAGKPIKSDEKGGGVVGKKKRLSYKNEDSVQNGCWILYEFFLHPSLRDKKQKAEDYVLCCLRKNGEPKAKIEKKRSKKREEEEFLEENCASDDGGISSMEQEVLLEPQAKRQRTAPSIDHAAELILPILPSENDDDADACAFADDLEGQLECSEDGNAPSSEAEAICIQGEENGGQQPLAANHLLPEEDFLMDELMGGWSMEEMERVLNGVSSNTDVAAAPYDSCTDEQQKTGDEDWLDSIDFDSDANNFFGSEMQFCQ